MQNAARQYGIIRCTHSTPPSNLRRALLVIAAICNRPFHLKQAGTACHGRAIDHELKLFPVDFNLERVLIAVGSGKFLEHGDLCAAAANNTVKYRYATKVSRCIDAKHSCYGTICRLLCLYVVRRIENGCKYRL